jgi:hypothetical protein
MVSVKVQPNKRLKLAGAYRSNGSGVLCPGEHGLSSTTLAPASGFARRLSAIRWADE